MPEPDDKICVGRDVYSPAGPSSPDLRPDAVYYDKDEDGTRTVDMNGTHYVHTDDLPQSTHHVDWSRA